MGFWNKETVAAAATATTATTQKEEPIWVALLMLFILGVVWSQVIWLLLVLNECWNGGMENLNNLWDKVSTYAELSLDDKGNLVPRKLTREREIHAFVIGFIDFKRARKVAFETFLLRLLGAFIPTKINPIPTKPDPVKINKSPDELFKKVVSEIGKGEFLNKVKGKKQ